MRKKKGAPVNRKDNYDFTEDLMRIYMKSRQPKPVPRMKDIFKKSGSK